MGDIAEDIINGIFCSQCGVFIGEATGYPRLCPECQEEQDNGECNE